MPVYRALLPTLVLTLLPGLVGRADAQARPPVPSARAASAMPVRAGQRPPVTTPGRPGTTRPTPAAAPARPAPTAPLAPQLLPPAQAAYRAVPGPWTFCGTLNAACEFLGRRDVRFVNSVGIMLMRTSYGEVMCAPQSFEGGAALPRHPARCEYGPMKVEVLANPRPAGSLLGASVTVPLGAPGWNTARVERTAALPLATDGTGTFRTSCALAGFQFNDPIGNPGRVGALPLFVFFGNTSAPSFTTAQAISTSGNSTCRGGLLDRSAHFMPAVVDKASREVQVPGNAMVHYTTGYNIDPATVRAPPPGLVMLAGDITARTVQRYVTEWTCRVTWMRNDGMIPDCPVGDAVRMWVHFPQCWDGTRLDSPGHRAHLAYPGYRSGARRSSCPATHPIVLPAITLVVEYEVHAGSSPRNWRLTTDNYALKARGGLSAHAYWIGGWDQATMNGIVSECLVAAVDCGLGITGRGIAIN